MRGSAILPLLPVWLLISALLGAEARAQMPKREDQVWTRPVCKTADELRELCKPCLDPIDPQQRKMKQYDEYLLFIVPYLGSEDQELRDAAVDILAQLMRIRRHIRASAFKEYLSRDNPINVRLVALAHSLYGFVGEGEISSYDQRRAEMEAAWTETLNDIAESPVTPPNFDVLVLGLRQGHDCVALLTPENQPVMVRRFMALASGGSKDDWRRAMELLRRLPAEAAASAVVEWYRVEPDAGVRAAYAEEVGSRIAALTSIFGRPSSVDEVEALKPILELAAKDTDREIAKKAKESLENAEAFLEKEKALSERDSR
jgi:hypothetical protein